MKSMQSNDTYCGGAIYWQQVRGCRCQSLASLTTYKMADKLLFRQLQAQPKVLNLNNQKLSKVPKLIGKFDNVLHINLKSNNISDLPPEFGNLVQVVYGSMDHGSVSEGNQRQSDRELSQGLCGNHLCIISRRLGGAVC